MMNGDKRQKVILGLIGLALVAMVWPIYTLTNGNVQNNNTVISANADLAPVSLSPQTYVSPSVALVTTNPHETAIMLNGPEATNNLAVNRTLAHQERYLALVNEYQMSEIERLIAEDNAQIAQSRYNAAVALSKISQLSGNATNLKIFINTKSDENHDYELIYCGNDNGEWTATLKKNGQFNEVFPGSVLPDGFEVIAMDDNGVLLQKGNSKELVTLNGVTPLHDLVPISTGVTENNSEKQPENKPVNSALNNKPTIPSVSTIIPLKQPDLLAAKIQFTKATIPMPVMPVPVSFSNTGIMQMDRNAYTIQIIADYQMSSINNFIASNHLENKAVALKTLRNNKPWYIAVYGQYPSSNVAYKEIAQMPDSIRAQHPFVRRIGEVQAKVVT